MSTPSKADIERAREALRFVEPQSFVGRALGMRMEADGTWFTTRDAIRESVAQAIATERERVLRVTERVLKHVELELPISVLDAILAVEVTHGYPRGTILRHTIEGVARALRLVAEAEAARG